MKRLWEQERSRIEQKQCRFEGQIRECLAEQNALSAGNLALYESFVYGGLTHDEYIRQKSSLAEKLNRPVGKKRKSGNSLPAWF